MDQKKVDMFIAMNASKLPANLIPALKDKLSELDDDKFTGVQCLELKDPVTLLIVSILVGGWGIDRFILGDVGIGILKLLTCGVGGILTIYDWCTIMNKTRQYNYDLVMKTINIL